MTDTEFEDRQRWDLDSWPEMYAKVRELQGLVFLSEPGLQINMMVFTTTSLTAGCRHCQAHGAYMLSGLGLEIDKIQALWSFESSDLFDDRERAALRFAVAAGSVPNSVGPAHHADLRAHFSDDEVRALLGVVGISGFMNRYNDSVAAVTDQESVDWARENLSVVGWDLGKHAGESHEQRSGPPGGSRA